MSLNRLFIYDPETNSAVYIAKGYNDGWVTYGDSTYQNKFYDKAIEFTGDIKGTRFQLKTERDLPNGILVYWEGGESVF